MRMIRFAGSFAECFVLNTLNIISYMFFVA